jgi:hypothetical protein
LTPNHLRSFSVEKDLLNNMLTPGVPLSVTVGIVASDPVDGTFCDPASPNASNLEQGVRAWGTTSANPAGPVRWGRRNNSHPDYPAGNRCRQDDGKP